MQIDKLNSSKLTAKYFTTPILQLFEDNLLLLLERDDNRLVPVSKHISYKYEGDLYGLLTHLGVGRNYHYITMRMNGLKSSADFDGLKEVIIVPEISNIDVLVASYVVK